MKDPILTVENLSFQYPNQEEQTIHDLSLQIERGDWIAIVGHNGSGKSTFAKILNGLQMPTSGSVYIDNIELTEETVWEIRKKVGMVFQNPDNQFVGTTVQDDVAFGLENLGVPRNEMVTRVHHAINKVGMEQYFDQEPHQLSGGQKQRVAIAGIIALQPSIIILDEATSMLDPQGRIEVINTLRSLKDELGITVLSITHDLEEAALADRIYVLNEGKVFAEGTPKDIFRLGQQLKVIGLDLPFAVKLKDKLEKHGIRIGDVISSEGLIEELWKLR
ncbi:energy-coupling factor ABC transporter ATP-binding protein [Sutcliffiella cohnii]